MDDLEDEFDNQAVVEPQTNTHEETLTRSDDFPAVSTPMQVGRAVDINASPIACRNTQEFVLLPRVANVPHWVIKPKDPVFTYEKIKSYKFVDDQVNTNKINMRKAQMLWDGEAFFKEVNDIRSQELLEHIATRAGVKGMMINVAKTDLMLVSAATSFDPRVRVQLGGQSICGQDSMKILGVAIDSDASFRTHTEKIAAKLRSKT